MTKYINAHRLPGKLEYFTLPDGSVGVRKKIQTTQAKRWRMASKILTLAALLLLGANLLPQLVSAVGPTTATALTKLLKMDDQSTILATPSPEKIIYQPPFDPTLPQENRIAIPSIGVMTQIGENTQDQVEETLKNGVWRVPDFGTAPERQKPMILVAHRFGYLKWSNKFRRENSFYNLPKLKNGDRVEISWNQRLYIYEIFESSEGSSIESYNADLILYTCKFLDSDQRIFKYAKLLEL